MFSYFSLKKSLIGIIFSVSIILPVLAKDLTVSFIDIGQGDSELIELPDGTNIMIDGGDKDAGPVLLGYLKERQIKKLDLVIITHPHLDHYGGLLETVKTIPVDQVLDSGAPTTSTTYLKLLKEFSAKKVKFKISRKGDQLNYGNGISINILAPEDPLLKNTRSDTNNASIVAKLTYNKISFLFTGDMETESQERILKAYPTGLNADILKVAHHGSRYTSSKEFLTAVNPKIAVISSGMGNSYGHPHQATLNRLNERNIQVYRTDLKGTIVISSDGNEYKIKTIKSGKKIKNQKNKTNLNNAPSEQLEMLPGLNAGKAAALIKQRPIKSWEQLETLGLSSDEIEQIKKLAYFGRKPAKGNSKPSYYSSGKDETDTLKNKTETLKQTGGKVDLNAATLAELIALPGIGEKTAQKIINGRPYKTVDELAKVPGMGKKRLKKLIVFFSVN